MRNKVLLLALTSIMMSLYRPACAQESQSALKAGDVFTGTVTGRFGPLAGANIREIGDDDYFNIELADSLGRFSMQINNPEHKFTVFYTLYEEQEIIPSKDHMDIKLEPKRPKSGKMVPADGAGGNFIKADNNYVLRQPVIPKEYICGYAVQPRNKGVGMVCSFIKMKMATWWCFITAAEVVPIPYELMINWLKDCPDLLSWLLIGLQASGSRRIMVS